MHLHTYLLVLTTALLSAFACHAQVSLPPNFHRLALSVDGVSRTGILYAPPSAQEKPTPVVFVFHGHGGSALNAGRSFAMFRHWPEAISVHLQGINTPGRLTDPEGKKTGWQSAPGDQADRDLKFFDATLTHLKATYKVDAKHIFATGHSNGGGFTYLLWETRPEVFCAFAPSAALSTRLATAPHQPKPLLHIAGTQDPLVKYAWQEKAMQQVKQINGCSAEGTPWATDCTLYPSSKAAPFVAFIHAGDHKFPEQAPPLIVKFFKEQAAAR